MNISTISSLNAGTFVFTNTTQGTAVIKYTLTN